MSVVKIHRTILFTVNKFTDIHDPNEDVEIVYLEKNGGAVFMTDPNGVTKISGDGTISNCTAELGGAIYMSGGKFELSGNAVINNNTATQNGGGVYVGDGDVDVLGGTINNNTAGQNGGGIYVAGNYSMTDGNVLSNNANYGGGIYVNDGIVTMYGGNVDHNVSTESGGGMYVSCDKKDAIVDIFSGSISDNQSKIGGGVSVVSNSDSHIYVTVGVNCVHPNLEDGIYDSFAYPSDSKECGEAHEEHVNHIDGLTHSTCPQIKNNVALNNGGGLFLNSPNTNLIFYFVIEVGNFANG